MPTDNQKLRTLKEILLAVKALEEEIISPDKARADAAVRCYNQLLKEFYADYEGMLAPQQYCRAAEDYEYFLSLITLAIAYWEEEEAKQKLH